MIPHLSSYSVLIDQVSYWVHQQPLKFKSSYQIFWLICFCFRIFSKWPLVKYTLSNRTNQGSKKIIRLPCSYFEEKNSSRPIALRKIIGKKRSSRFNIHWADAIGVSEPWEFQLCQRESPTEHPLATSPNNCWPSRLPPQ